MKVLKFFSSWESAVRSRRVPLCNLGAVIFALFVLAPTGYANAATLKEALDATNLEWSSSGDANWFYQTFTTKDGIDAAQSGGIGDNQSTWIQTTLTGPGTLTFWWKVSSEADRDYLKFYVDGSELVSAGKISGDVGWMQKTASISNGVHTLKWKYSKDGSTSLGSDCGWVDQVVWAPAYSAVSSSPNPVFAGFTTGSGSYLNSTTCTVTATANQGYTFANWTEGGSNVWDSSINYTFAVLSNRTLVANFTTNSYTIATSPSPLGGGTITGGGSHAYNSSCVLIATPKANYTFTSWTEGARIVSTSPNYTFQVGSYRTLVANFTPANFYITSSSNPMGGGLTSGSGTRAYGSLCTLIAAPSAGYIFTAWTEGFSTVSLSTNYTFVVSGDRTLVANFVQIDYTTTTTCSSPSGGGTITGGGLYEYGSSCTVSATANTWHTFVNWTEGTNVVSDLPNYTFTVVRSLTLVANFIYTRTIGHAVDAPELVWTTGGEAGYPSTGATTNWFPQTTTTHDGVDAAQSGTISDGGTSWMQTTVVGPRTLSFWWKVHTLDTGDKLKFFVDSIEQPGTISGQVDWTPRTYSIPEGIHTLRWAYVKNFNGSFAPDCGWVDQVVLMPTIKCTVIFDAQGGNAPIPAATQVIYGATYSSLATTTRTGYTFEGWWTGTDVTGTEVTTETKVTTTTDHTLYAKWTISTYTVTFNAQSGTVNPSSRSVTYGNNYGALPIPTRTGYIFKGWWTGTGGTGSQVTESVTVTATTNHVLYSAWVLDPFIVNSISKAVPIGNTNAVLVSDINSGDGGTSVKLGGIGLLADGEMAGIAVSVTGPGVLSFDWKVSSELDWDWLSFYEVGFGETNRISGTGGDWDRVTVNVGGALGASHTFRWEYEKDPVMEYVGEDCGLVDAIVWSSVYKLVLNNGAGAGMFTNGAIVSISANSSPQYQEFSHWTGDTNTVADISSMNTAVTMTGTGLVLTATYKPILYPVIVTKGSGSGSYPFGSTVGIGAEYQTGKIFYRWAGDVDTVANVMLPTTTVQTVGGTLAVTATYSVLVTVNNGSGDGWHPVGSVVPITADPASQLYTDFTTWTGDATGQLDDPSAPTAQLTVPDGAASLTANYAPTISRVAGCYGRTFAESGTSGGISMDTGGGLSTGNPTVKFGGTGIIPDNGFAAIETEVLGNGTISFWWKVASQLDGDYLEFWVDDVKITSVSGTRGPWVQVSHRAEGVWAPHTFKWQYVKNSSLASSTDAGWLDDIVWIGDMPAPVIAPDILSTMPNESVFSLMFLGERGIPYTVYSNVVLSATGWVPMNTVPEERGEVNGLFQFEATIIQPAELPSCFYRAGSLIPEIPFNTAPFFTQHPVSQTAEQGVLVVLSASAKGNPAPTYQWYKDGVALVGKIASTLSFTMGSQAVGSYQCKASSRLGTVASQTASVTVEITPPENVSSFVATPGNGQISLSWTNPADSDFAGVKILRKTGSFPASATDGTVVHDATGTSKIDTGLSNGTVYYYKAFSYDGVPNYASGVTAIATPVAPTIPSGMVLIPAGTNAGADPDFGAYSLPVSAFYMDKYEVTKTQWDAVYTWAIANGYGFDNAGSGKASNHPVQTVSWYDVVKWCNARSQKEGRPAVYTAGGAVYKTGQSDNVVQTSAAGYRLPTDTEWEYAARGGVANRRFPWGDTDTIQHARANYYSSSSYAYDTSPTRGYHPTYATDGYPYTSPAGSFASNGYGLYDMSGNVWEWCFNWYPGYEGSRRVMRGGCWGNDARGCRVGSRVSDAPSDAYFTFGFRAVLPPGQ